MTKEKKTFLELVEGTEYNYNGGETPYRISDGEFQAKSVIDSIWKAHEGTVAVNKRKFSRVPVKHEHIAFISEDAHKWMREGKLLEVIGSLRTPDRTQEVLITYYI